jgi:betaine-homocysteine S-methyltransferase
MATEPNLLERLSRGVVLGAEGYVFELERRGYIKAGPYVPEVVLDFPEAVLELHREFLRAGAEVMVALTYYGDREKLKVVGREGDLEALNRQAVRLAKQAAAEGGALVAGNTCNTWVYDHNDKDATSEKVRRIYREQVGWAAEEGVDFIIAETLDYLGEGLLALEVIKEFGLPALVTFSSVQDRLRDGYSHLEACRIMAQEGAEVVGLNCSRGPATMLPMLAEIRQSVSAYVAAQPVPYRTTPEQFAFQSLKEPGRDRSFPIGLEPFLCTRFEMADFAVEAARLGVNYIGICCGGAPHHVRAMAEALGRQAPASRYSPALDLHPMIGKEVKGKDRVYLEFWKDQK